MVFADSTVHNDGWRRAQWPGLALPGASVFTGAPIAPIR